MLCQLIIIFITRDELMRMLAEDELREAVLLIFANKQVYLDDIKSLKSLSSFTIMSFHELRRIFEKIIPTLDLKFLYKR